MSHNYFISIYDYPQICSNFVVWSNGMFDECLVDKIYGEIGFFSRSRHLMSSINLRYNNLLYKQLYILYHDAPVQIRVPDMLPRRHLKVKPTMNLIYQPLVPTPVKLYDGLEIYWVFFYFWSRDKYV